MRVIWAASVSLSVLACDASRGTVLRLRRLGGEIDSGASLMNAAAAPVQDAASGPPGDPLVVWHFDEGSGSTSQSDSGLTALFDGAAWAPDGIRGSALRVGEGGTDHAYVDPNPELALRGSMTLALWYRLRIAHTEGCWALINLAGVSTDGLRANDLYGFGFSDLHFYWYHESGVQVAQWVLSTTLPDAALGTGSWHHAVAVRNSETNQIDFYLDATLLSSAGYAANPEGGDTSSLHFGIDAEWDTDPETLCFVATPADLDEVLFYDRALTAGEVTELFDYYATP